MRLTAGCLRPRLADLVLATGWLAACAPAGSEPPIAVCPPVVEYSPEFQARAADELAVLPEESAIAEMLSDYAVTREQAGACRSRGASKERTTPGGILGSDGPVASSRPGRDRLSCRADEHPLALLSLAVGAAQSPVGVPGTMAENWKHNDQRNPDCHNGREEQHDDDRPPGQHDS